MEFQIPITIKQLSHPIRYGDRIMLIGSCFTEHIGNSLQDLKFSVLQNPNGILFDPHSVSRSLLSYVNNRKYESSDFFKLYEVWHSWNHHGRFSRTDVADAVEAVNQSQQSAHEFLSSANWIIITLGSSFSYRLTSKAPQFDNDARTGSGVANCHRAPAQWFEKYLMTIEEIHEDLNSAFETLLQYNPALRIILTVSPVRHIRDGVIENNRSKARLIEAVHQLASEREPVSYFPSYELVIDVLRDYRFYDIDLVHPNYMATEFVLEKFSETCIGPDSRSLMEEVKDIITARKHKAFQPNTNAHRQFLETYFEKTRSLQKKHPFLDLQEELGYFRAE